MASMLRVKAVRIVKGFLVRLTLTDGSTRRIDLEPFLRGPVFERVRGDRSYFRKMTVDPDLGTLVWPNGGDICPDVLCRGRVPASLEGVPRAPSRSSPSA